MKCLEALGMITIFHNSKWCFRNSTEVKKKKIHQSLRYYFYNIQGKWYRKKTGQKAIIYFSLAENGQDTVLQWHMLGSVA